MPRPADRRSELQRLHAECDALDAEYLRLTAPLALAAAATGLEPSADACARIDANRARRTALEQARHDCLRRAAAQHPRLKPLVDWFGLEAAAEAHGRALHIDYRPRAAQYHARVTVSLAFNAAGEPVGASVTLDAALLDARADAAALRDLLKSVLELVAAPGDAAARELGLQIQCCDLPAPLLRHTSAPRPQATTAAPVIAVLGGGQRAASARLAGLRVACTRFDGPERIVFDVRREPDTGPEAGVEAR